MDDVQSVVLLVCDILLALVLLTAIPANAIVLIIFYRRPSLRTLPNRFVVNLLCTNLVTTCVLVPLVLADQQGVLSAVSDGLAACVCSASILAVLLIALDQYCAVVDPLRYHARISKGRSVCFMLVTWTLSCTLGGLHTFELCAQTFAVVYGVLVFILPFLSILCMYSRIYKAAHNNSKRTRLTEADRTPSVRSNSSSSLVSSLKYRISNASVFRYREETRAARISALVIVMVLVCWFPYVAVLILHSRLLPPPLQDIPQYVHRISLTFLVSGAFISPCLFAYRNQRIQREARKMLGCPIQKKERRNHRPRLELLPEEAIDKHKGEFVAIPESALVVDTSRSSFSSGGSTQGTSSTLETD